MISIESIWTSCLLSQSYLLLPNIHLNAFHCRLWTEQNWIRTAKYILRISIRTTFHAFGGMDAYYYYYRSSSIASPFFVYLPFFVFFFDSNCNWMGSVARLMNWYFCSILNLDKIPVSNNATCIVNCGGIQMNIQDSFFSEKLNVVRVLYHIFIQSTRRTNRS